MNVTISVDSLSPRLSGIGRYTWELCKRVPNHAVVDRVDYVVSDHLVVDPERLLFDDAVYHRKRRTNWIVDRLFLRRPAFSLVHGPNYFLPQQADSGVITVHDLSVFRYPETHPSERRDAFARGFEDSVRRAGHIITDTETVRQELVADFGVAEANITAVPLGVDQGYRPRPYDVLQPLLAPVGLSPGAYALCVSAIEPRKKIGELLNAWRGLPAAVRQSTPLVLAGGEGWLNDSLHQDIRNAIAAGWCKYLGFVPESTLTALYAGASLFLYPSIYEGFGLPPIEAMASGVPVLVSNRSCLPEVCGDAAGYVDPDDIQGFSNAIAEALANSEWRERAIARGLERARRYSWARCAAETVQVYSAVCR